ncbi:MFS transporter [Oscillospiraceae bacterium MB08-C2-2]|nr:MFS transporter [Oscillospiraceae bacterium MB08-C2-2]
MNNSVKQGSQGYSYLMMIGHICTDMSQAALPALLPFLVAQRGIDYASAAGLLFASSFLSSLVQPVLGVISDRKAMPWLMTLGMLISGVGIAFIGFVDNYWAMFGLVTFAGLGSAMFHPEGGRMANCVAGEHKGRSVGIFSAGGNIGFIVGPIMATAAVSVWGIKGGAIIILPVIAISLVFLFQQKKFLQFSSAMTDEERKLNADNGQKDDWPAFFKLCISLFARSIIHSGLQAFIPLYWVGVLIQTQERGSMMVTVMAIAATIATLISGRLADRFGFRRVICTSFGVIFPLLILTLLTKSVMVATVFVIFLSAAVNFAYTPSVALGQKYLPNRLGLASGITMGLTVSIGGIFSPMLGKIGDIHGLPTAMYVLSGIALIGFLGTLLIKEPNRPVQSVMIQPENI